MLRTLGHLIGGALTKALGTHRLPYMIRAKPLRIQFFFSSHTVSASTLGTEYILYIAAMGTRTYAPLEKYSLYF